MKTKIFSVPLVVILFITFSTSVIAAVLPTELSSIGTVQVKEGTAGGEDTGTIDPENPGEVLPETDPNGPGENTNDKAGNLVIEKTSNLSFAEVKTSADDITVFALPTVFVGNITRGAYVQFADVRSGGTYGYTVTAELTQQFTSGSNKLNGATIEFINGELVPQENNDNIEPSNVKSSFKLTEDGDAIDIVSADKDKKEGKGRYIMSFGSTKDNTADKSVALRIPAKTASNMAVGNYEAVVTWKIASVN